MTALNYTIIEWTDGCWSFESTDVLTGRVIFASHTWGYPLYRSLWDAKHAVDLCEDARAHGRGFATDDTPRPTTSVVRKRAATRRREQRLADERLEVLVEKYGRKCYTRHPLWGMVEAVR
jgi:hypothetical protein